MIEPGNDIGFVDYGILEHKRLLLRPRRAGEIPIWRERTHWIREVWDGEIIYDTRAQTARAVYKETRPGCTEEYHDMDVCMHLQECGCSVSGRTVCAECMPEW